MRKKLLLITAFCLCALTLAGCGGKNNSTAETSSSEATAETQSIDREAVPFEQTVGVWTYGTDIIFHSADGNRYQLKEDSSGTVQDKNGKTYTVSECEYKLLKIMNLTEDNINVREGRYSAKFLGSVDYPDGYKTMIISYQKSDLFDIEKLEEAVKGGVTPADAETESESQTETETQPSETESETTTEAPTETETELESVTETQPSESATETETETSADASEKTEASEIPADAEYAAIYKKVQDFLETDNYKQKDAGNRSLEIFNYLHNLADSNIEEASITNDTAKNEVSFKCYEKYTITVNNTEGTITVSEN